MMSDRQHLLLTADEHGKVSWRVVSTKEAALDSIRAERFFDGKPWWKKFKITDLENRYEPDG